MPKRARTSRKPVSWFTDPGLNEELKLRLPFLAFTTSIQAGAPLNALAKRLQDLSEGSASQPIVEDSVLASFLRPCVPWGANPRAAFWSRRLAIAQADVIHAVSAVGVIEMSGSPGFRFAGAGWMASQNTLVTTTQVAAICRLARSSAVRFIDGKSCPVAKIADDQESGLAFLVLKNSEDLPSPFPLADREPAMPYVAAVGFPFEDSRCEGAIPPFAYSNAYNQYCVAPGRVLSNGKYLTHDCALPGNSAGALILDLDSGRAAGLHMGGLANGVAIGASQIAAALERQGLEPAASVEGTGESVAFEAVKLTPQDYRNRKGYVANFLGTPVPLPVPIGPWKKDFGELLAYTHFSVGMSKSRKLCFYAAVNIDGKELQSVRRADKADRWLFDPRLDKSAQCGRNIYRGGYLDLGHMVRRVDPVWGKEFLSANDDTFHYTNACPQHKDLNRKIWNDLEDYLLTNTGSNSFKVTVFTGPVLSANDPAYRGIQLPQQYWKVAVMIDPDNGKLHATAYILSQKDMITGLEFVFGEYRTYQLPLERLEKLTNLDFGKLRQFDPKRKGKTSKLESAAAEAFTEILGANDLVV